MRNLLPLLAFLNGLVLVLRPESFAGQHLFGFFVLASAALAAVVVARFSRKARG